MAADLLAGLTPAQAEAVTSTAAPLAVVAGPGSGKTRVVTRRIAFRCRTATADPAHVLAVTFSRRASVELLSRLRGLGLPTGGRRGGIVAGTFHAVAWTELARWHRARGVTPPAVAARPGVLLRRAVADALGHAPDPGDVAAVAAEIGWARSQTLDVDGYAAAARAGSLPSDVVAAAWRAYAAGKRRAHVVDLDDLLDAAAGLMAEPDASAAVRWRYRHVFVDEYQDLNPAHHRLLRAWVGDRSDVCLVGDPDQAVYGFNGAMPALFGRLAHDWPGISVVTLADNHRSSPEVVRFAAAVRPLGPSGGQGSRRPPGPVPAVAEYADDRTEARAVAAAAYRRSGRMAVLARTNARLDVVAEALQEAGVPWRLRDTRPLADRPDVQRWLAGIPATAPAADLADVDFDGGATIHSLLRRALGEFRETAPLGSAAAFGAWLAAAEITGDDLPARGVELVTFHRAKGLEWPTVWVVGVEDGLVPLGRRGRPGNDIAEEQRLLYVALTRAEEELTVSWASRRTGPAGDLVETGPSPWIAALQAARSELATQPPPSEQVRRLAAARTHVGAGRGPEADRLTALRAWRDVRARAAAVPPAAVLPDAAIAALARAAPASEAEVAGVAGGGFRARRWAGEIAAVLGVSGAEAAPVGSIA